MFGGESSAIFDEENDATTHVSGQGVKPLEFNDKAVLYVSDGRMTLYFFVPHK